MKVVLFLIFIFIFGGCSSFNNLSSERREQLEFRAFNAKDANALAKAINVSDPDIIACYQGKIDETVKKVKRDIANETDTKWLFWSKLAACHFLEGEISLSIYYNQLILREFSNKKINKAFPYNNMGVIYFEKNMPEQAEGYFLQAKKIAPNSIDVNYNLSSLYLHYGEFDKALIIYNRFMNQVYNDRELFYGYALALTYKGYFQTLERDLNKYKSKFADFDKLELLDSLKDYLTGKKETAYKSLKSLEGKFLTDVEEKAKDRVVALYEKELAAKEKALQESRKREIASKTKKNEKKNEK